MATVGERRPLPSPEAMLGQSWNLWVEASKLPGKDGTELDESFKEYGKNREVMGLCREGLTPYGETRGVEGGILSFQKRLHERLRGFWKGHLATCNCLPAIKMNFKKDSTLPVQPISIGFILQRFIKRIITTKELLVGFFFLFRIFMKVP
ncbi:hypothetical protein Celaphus_00010390, partial [Cervus elaphus hippelaphus]